MILAAAFVWQPVRPLSQTRFEEFLRKGKQTLPQLLERAIEATRQIFALRGALETSPHRYAGIEKDLARLIPAEFPQNVPFNQFERIPRFLRAIQIRAERAVLRPAQDAQKAAPLEAFKNWEQKVPAHNRATFRWMLEELRVSIFAQELGTAETVSIQKLQRLMEG
jgi:ATP-dependent helicase HrpA